MAEEEESNQARFGWNYAGEVEFQDDEGNWVRAGPVPPEIQEILDRHEEKKKAAKAKDARMKKQPKIKITVHQR